MTSYGYNIAGQRTNSTDARGIVTTHTLDALGRVTATTYPTPYKHEDMSFVYDQLGPGCPAAVGENFPQGRLTKFTDESGYTCLYYDRRGNVSRRYQVTNGVPYEMQYAHNFANQLTQLIYPNGLTVNYSRDGLGRIQAITASGGGMPGTPSVLNSVAYAPFDGPSAVQFGNGQTLSYTRDANQRISGVQSPALNLEFRFDWQGNIVEEGPPVVNPNNAFSYDPMYRLTEHRSQGNVVESYAYDKIGNRLTKDRAGPQTYAYDYTNHGHRVQSVAGQSRGYDANGNTTLQFASQYLGQVTGQYNARNRLIGHSVVQSSFGERSIATYNAIGERVLLQHVVVAEPAIRFVYGGTPHLLFEDNEGTGTSSAYIYLNQTPVAMVRGGAMYYIHTDHLGTPRAVTNSAGTLVWRWKFGASNGLSNAFGENLPDALGDQQPLDFRLRFPGQYADPFGVTWYNYFRDYEPGTGRYVESDPIGLKAGVNTFSYSAQNPVIRFDLDGQWSRVREEDWAEQDYSVCSYYAKVAKKDGCKYHKEAERICRGRHQGVNIMSDTCGLQNTRNLNCIRSCLARRDDEARKDPDCQKKSECSGGVCTRLSCIHQYHNDCFVECGSSKGCYGGNYWDGFPNDGD